MKQSEVEEFNRLCQEMIPVGYANIKTFEHKEIEVAMGYFFIVNSLRNMNKKQLKELFYNIGLKQIMKISIVSTKLSINSIVNDDYEKENSPWKVISEGILK